MKELQNKKIVFIIANKNFRDEELFLPKEILQKAGADITIASSSLNTAVGVLGAKVNSDITIDKLEIDNYDCVVFVGGGGAREYFNNHVAHKIAQKAFNAGKIIGAICIATVILAKSGILKNKNATVFQSEINILKELEVLYNDKDLVEDGNIITANGPAAAGKFGEAIKKKLSFQEK